MKTLIFALAVAAATRQSLDSSVPYPYRTCAECVVLESGRARCAVETFGARVVSFTIDGRELLWGQDNGVSEKPKLGEVWRHGGIPLAWPWFGRIGAGDCDIHGYAWYSPFVVTSRTADALTLLLDTGSLELEYVVRIVDDRLVLMAKTTNRSNFAHPFSVAFHPYFRVEDLARSKIGGVSDAPLIVTNAIDSSVNYMTPQRRREFVLDDVARGCRLAIAAEGLTGVNVWNPGAKKKCPGFIPGEEWRHFVAVEPFARGVNRFNVLPPGASSTLTMEVGERK